MSVPSDDLHRKEITISAAKANLYVVLLSIPLALMLGIPFFLIWRDLFSLATLRLYMQNNIHWLKTALPFLIFIPMLAGIVLHELLHGITWAQFASKGFKAIRFGMIWKALTPYCHCKEPLSLNGYRLGVVMPGLVLGFLPLGYAFIVGNIGVFVFGFVFTVAAGGDFLMLYLLRNEHASSLIEDHPDKIGCFVYSSRP